MVDPGVASNISSTFYFSKRLTLEVKVTDLGYSTETKVSVSVGMIRDQND